MHEQDTSDILGAQKHNIKISNIRNLFTIWKKTKTIIVNIEIINIKDSYL